MSRFKLYFLLIFSLCVHYSRAQISDKRLCIDLECNSPISRAKALTRYFGPDAYHLSFKPNDNIVIYSKSAGSNEELWGAEINGKRGYIPKKLVRETKILGTPSLLVDTEIIKDPKQPQVPMKTSTLMPSKVKQNYEVTDGTTIYYDVNDKIVEKTEDEAVEITLNNVQGDLHNDTLNEKVDKVSVDNIQTKDNVELGSDSTSATNDSVKATIVGNTSIENNGTKSNFDNNLEPERSGENVNENENGNEKLEGQIEISAEDLSTESGQSDLKNAGYFAGIFNGLGMGNEIKEKRILEDEEINADIANKVIKEEFFDPVKKSSEDVTKPDVLINKSTSELEENEKYVGDPKLETSYSFNIEPENDSTNQLNLDKNSESLENVLQNQKKEDMIEKDKLEDNNIKLNVEEVGPDTPNQSIDEVLKVEYNADTDLKINQDSPKFQEDIQKTIREVESQQVSPPFQEKSNDLEINTSNEKDFVSPLLTELDFTKASTQNENISNDFKVKSEEISQASTENEVEPPTDTELPEKKEQIIKLGISNVLNSSDSKNEATTLQNKSAEQTLSKYPTVIGENVAVNPDFQQNASEPKKNSSQLTEDPNVEEKDVHSVVPTEEDFDIQKEPEILNNMYNNYITGDQEPIMNVEQMKQNELENEKSDLSENISNNNPLVSEKNEMENNELENMNTSNELSSKYFHQENAVVENESKDELFDPNRSERHKKIEENIDVNEAPSIFSYFQKDNENEKKGSSLEVDNLNQRKNDEAEHLEMMDGNGIEKYAEDNEISDDAFCTKEECPNHTKTTNIFDFSLYRSLPMELPNLNSDFFLYLVTTAISVILFLLGYLAIDKSRREGPLIAKINQLEKEFLVILREKEILAEQIENGVQKSDDVESQDYLNLQQEYKDIILQKQALEEQVQTLEKELENSTEVGLELNRMLSEMLSSENADETLMSNIEGLQSQLAEQQGIVSSMKEMLNLKETENHELNLELDISNKKVVELQSELDRLLSNIIKIEEEKELQEKNSETEITQLRENINSLSKTLENNVQESNKKVDVLKNELSTLERNLQLKIKEYDGLKISIQQMKNIKNANTFESLLEVTSIKAELEQLKTECQSYCENLRKEKELNIILEKRAKAAEDEMDTMKIHLDEVDKARLELETKLQVLSNYFKEKEEQLQKELSKYESMWSAKQGEATSTSERIKYLQSEIQNYKSQNESLKQEIISQEVELKSQISVLEKKVHENWVSARQAERRLEDLKQEAAQLRNRLTLRERALLEDKTHNRMQSPLEQNGDLPISPLHLETPSSPPLLYSSRDHITKSPPMLGMPPPFLPPPPGAPFLPPPHLPFMPPPLPDMFPGDHRPPPLGRMSSPPLNSRYSPDRRPYSPYDRRSPSPSYDESEYGTSPVHHRRYSPFSGRMDHRRMQPPPGRINGRTGALSSGSGNSNESLDEINHANSKV